MAELVPLTNAVAALMIVSAVSGFGGDDAILADAPASVPSEADAAAVNAQAKAASEAAAVNAQAAPAAMSAPEAKAAPPADDRARETRPVCR